MVTQKNDLNINLGVIKTISELLCYRAQIKPDNSSYVFISEFETKSAVLTYQELDQQAKAIASKLQELGLVGERALLIYSPGLDFIAAFFGCLYAGVVAVPAYPPRRHQSMLRIQEMVTDAQAKVALTTKSSLVSIERKLTQNPELAALQWLTTDDIDKEKASEWQKPSTNSDTLALLQYTSGSTGKPKGVMISHGNLLHNLNLIHKCFGHSPSSRGVIWLPPYHDMGLIGGLLQPLYGGFPVTLMSPASFLQKPLRWLEAISHTKATTSGAPNFAYELCVRRITSEQKTKLDLSSWEVAFIGAEPVRADTMKRFADYFSSCGFRYSAFYPCYGMAETTLIISGGLKNKSPVVCSLDNKALEQNRVVAVSREQDNAKKIVGCGKSLAEGKIMIVDPESSTKCPSDRIGEIWVSSKSVAQGYWNQPKQTQETFNAYLRDSGAKPFFRTGDLGFIQDKELFVTSRLKDLIIIRGRNYYPQDIELTAQNSHPALRKDSGAAFSIEIKGDERLVIVQEIKRTFYKNLNIPEVLGNISQAVNAQYQLRIYAIALAKPGNIPKTSSGKIQRNTCRDEFLNGTLNMIANSKNSLIQT